jgi:hypothetical protein
MITIALSFRYTIYFLRIQNIYDNINKTGRERLVIDLYYNQGKTYREISKEARISPRDIGVILNKAVEGKKTEGNEEQDNTDSEKNQNLEQQRHLSLSTQAYKLFSDRKTPLEVAVTLNLIELTAQKDR